MTRPDVIVTMRFQVEDTGIAHPLMHAAAVAFGKLTTDFKIKEAAMEIQPAASDDEDRTDLQAKRPL